VDNYWLKTPEYSDNSGTVNNSTGRSMIRNDPTEWTGFLSALSKCVELDGSPYPSCNSTTQLNTPCSTASNPINKPMCYAVAVQSDFQGNSIRDSSVYHSFKYHLVELPSSNKLDTLLPSEFKNKPVDNNFLFCQPQFYTWVKNPRNNAVYNPHAPNYKNTPSLTPSSTSRTLNCPVESYPSLNADNPNASTNTISPGFFDDTPSKPMNFGSTVTPVVKSNRNKYILITVGVIVGIIFIYWFYSKHIARQEDSSSSSSSEPAVNVTSKGGYFYY